MFFPVLHENPGLNSGLILHALYCTVQAEHRLFFRHRYLILRSASRFLFPVPLLNALFPILNPTLTFHRPIPTQNRSRAIQPRRLASISQFITSSLHFQTLYRLPRPSGLQRRELESQRYRAIVCAAVFSQCRMFGRVGRTGCRTGCTNIVTALRKFPWKQLFVRSPPCIE